MGRKSKLSEAQWSELFARKAEGESNRSLAEQYGISETSIREREAKIGKTVEVQKVARMIYETDAALKSLPRTQQITAQNLAEKLKAISNSLASAAELGAKTAHRLHALANGEVAKVDDADPLKSMEALKGVSVLTKLANDSSQIAVNLLSANRDTVKQVNAPAETEAPKGVLVVPGAMDEATWEKMMAKHQEGGA